MIYMPKSYYRVYGHMWWRRQALLSDKINPVCKKEPATFYQPGWYWQVWR
jgi:hypothetical protein